MNYERMRNNIKQYKMVYESQTENILHINVHPTHFSYQTDTPITPHRLAHIITQAPEQHTQTKHT